MNAEGNFKEFLVVFLEVVTNDLMGAFLKYQRESALSAGNVFAWWGRVFLADACQDYSGALMHAH